MSEYSQPSYSVKIEEEYQFVDPESRQLRGFSGSYGLTLFHGEETAVQDGEPAPLRSQPTACADMKEARRELLRVRGAMRDLAASQGLRLMAAGAHPFSSWEQAPEETRRMRALIEETHIVVQRLYAFGMYVQIGVEDRNLAIDVMNATRYLLPHILCLANSSPFWEGADTGLASYRSVLLDALPRTGIPNAFRSHNHYLSYVDTLLRTNSIPSPDAVLWDIRPREAADQDARAPGAGPALEIRVCDALPDIDDVLSVAALIQAIVAWMVDLRHRNMSFRLYDRTLIAENKWRAVRYGLRGRLLDFGIEQEVPFRDLLLELLERVDPVLDRLNCRGEVERIHSIAARGASSDQQRRVWRDSGEDGAAVVDFLVAQTEKDL